MITLQVKGETFRDVLGEFLGEGIFASDGPAWSQHRKVAVKMFSKRLLEEGTAVALAKCAEVDFPLFFCDFQ